MPSQAYAVILHSGVPQEFLALMDGGYLLEERGLKYLLCSSIELAGSFVVAGVLRDNTTWPVHIPVSFVLAIADMAQTRVPPGFLSDAQK